MPTLKELGYPIVQNAPFGLVAPGGTDNAVVERLHTAFKQAMDQENFRDALRKFDIDPQYMSSRQFTAFAHDITQSERPIIDRLGLQRP